MNINVNKRISLIIFLGLIITACHTKDNGSKAATAYPQGTFGYDLDFLSSKDSLVILKNSDDSSMIVVSPKYQGKVFTSTAAGLNGKSFGWIKYKTFDLKTPDSHMNTFGGEDRLWLGPEGGKFSLFFKPGTKMIFDFWHTPPAFDSEAWSSTSKSDTSIIMTKGAHLINYAGTILNLKLERTISILPPETIKHRLGITYDGQVKAVAFKTVNVIQNTGDNIWDKQSGAPCLWNLDMFTPSEQTVIIVPYNKQARGKVATTNYFGEIPADRIKYKNDILFFRADGKSRGKLGLSPLRAAHIAGSYDAQNKILTLILFDVDQQATYLNQEWKTDGDPFTGDAVNAYNDGPLADGTQMGPFYELESVSPAAFLKPQQKLSHTHSVFHFTGSEDQLNQISIKTLGISIQDIRSIF